MVFRCGCQDDRLDGTPREDAGDCGMGRRPPALLEADVDASTLRVGGEDDRVLILEVKKVSGLVKPLFMVTILESEFFCAAQSDLEPVV